MPKTTLLVLNSFSYPFSTLPNPRAKPGIFEQIKQVLVKVSVARNVAVSSLCENQLPFAFLIELIGSDYIPASYENAQRGRVLRKFR